MTSRTAALLCIILVVSSCQKFAEGRRIFHDLLVLREDVAKQFHERVTDVDISATGAMTIRFTNSPLNSATREQKQKRADEVAAFVVDHYKHPIASVSTKFASKSGPSRVEETYVGKLH